MRKRIEQLAEWYYDLATGESVERFMGFWIGVSASLFAVTIIITTILCKIG